MGDVGTMAAAARCASSACARAIINDPARYAAHYDWLVRHADKLGDRVILAGDFNAAPWSWQMMRFAGRQRPAPARDLCGQLALAAAGGAHRQRADDAGHQERVLQDRAVSSGRTRTVHDPLESRGSRCSAVAMA